MFCVTLSWPHQNAARSWQKAEPHWWPANQREAAKCNFQGRYYRVWTLQVTLGMLGYYKWDKVLRKGICANITNHRLSHFQRFHFILTYFDHSSAWRSSFFTSTPTLEYLLTVNFCHFSVSVRRSKPSITDWWASCSDHTAFHFVTCPLWEFFLVQFPPLVAPIKNNESSFSCLCSWPERSQALVSALMICHRSLTFSESLYILYDLPWCCHSEGSLCAYHFDRALNFIANSFSLMDLLALHCWLHIWHVLTHKWWRQKEQVYY